MFRQSSMRFPRRRRQLFAGVVLSLWLPAETLSFGKELLPYPPITFHVSATDAGGQPVTDLTAKDFKVVDNGVVQKDIAIRAVQSETEFTLVLAL